MTRKAITSILLGLILAAVAAPSASADCAPCHRHYMGRTYVCTRYVCSPVVWCDEGGNLISGGKKSKVKSDSAQQADDSSASSSPEK